jgi:REP element-mobilizing transposase RayT
MSRTARIKSSTGIYHIITRGINQQNIFSSDVDYERFLNTLTRYCRKSNCEIYAYCLMDNHIHLLLKEGQEPLATTMKRIGTSYVYYYNWQYNRKGHLFQDRYKSEPVEDDAYFLTVLRYIHQNPVKAGITDDPATYPWSSYTEYTDKVKLVNTSFTLKLFNQDHEKAIEEFISFHHQPNEDKCLDITEKRDTFSDKMIRQLVSKKYNIELAVLSNTKPETQRKVMKYLKELNGCSLRQLSRLTGLTLYQVRRV